MKLLDRRRRLPSLTMACLAAIAITAPGCSGTPSDEKRPRLVLQITIDQLRPDYISRFEKHLRPDGFRYLIKRGVMFTDARYKHTSTDTGTGHATLFTGAGPRGHGIVSNRWYDRVAERAVYTVEDGRHHVLGYQPTPGSGSSPRNLMSSTIGDELVMASAGRSRVFSASIKDRAAILPAGHLGKAFWYSKRNGEFVTSTFYYAEYPKWLKEWNREKPASRFRDRRWRLTHDRSSYMFGQNDDRGAEIPFLHLGRTFPHTLNTEDDEQFYTVLRATPFADRLLLEFVKELVAREKLGRKGHTDFLSISFSATDYIGHVFGPASLEAEENFLRVDHTLSDLFEFIDKKVGLGRTAIVLSSDHGVAEAPEYLADLGFEGGRLIPRDFIGRVNKTLARRYGNTRDLIVDFVGPDLVLDEEQIERLGLDVGEVERAAAREVERIPGFAMAVARTDLLEGTVPSSPVYRRMLESFHSERGGNVRLVPSQGWLLANEPYPTLLTAMHGSPWVYDSHVPLLIAGPGIKRGVVNRRVAPRDIAPTLAAYLRIRPPSGSEGRILPDVVPARPRPM